MVVIQTEIDLRLAERRALLDEALPRIVQGLVERGATLVVLFGSEATGRRSPLADLDLLVVMESDEPFVERLARLYRELQPGVALDLLAYTPQELAALRHRPFIARILEEGRILHAA